MGIFSKLFGRKKKDSSEVQAEPKNEEKKSDASDEVTLEEVNESLDEVNTITKDAPAQEPKKPEPEPSKAKPSDDKPLYHIKKHSDGWQVIKEGTDKAYRVFKYQKEAIEFANKEKLDYQVYKADGTLRK